LLWLALSFALRLYLHFFNSYTATDGSLGSVMTWTSVPAMQVVHLPTTCSMFR
jgi:uncharacterized BrkB/YihY/UPF0761 family membrane protein